MLGWVRSLFSRKHAAKAPRRRRIQASYDAAQPSVDNRKHWLAADALSAREANSLDVRKTLRERSRYERANNSYLQGIGLTLANNLVGTGPRLQVLTPNETANAAIEAQWAAWAKERRFADRLRTAKLAKTFDGEAFALLVSNRRSQHSVQLDVRLIECDQCHTPFLNWSDPLAVDGIRFDPDGNPVSYDFLKYHPGDSFAWTLETRTFKADRVLHWFRQDRPGQVRGIPEITPALSMFPILRRWTLATLTAAEVAASFAALLETDGNPDTEVATVAEDFEEQEISRGMMTALPAGYTAKQLDSKHPNTLYDLFEWCIMRQVARCLNLPLNLALLDSSKHNFSSARLDHLIYRQAVAVEREDCEREWLDPTLAAWLDEAVMIPGLLPAGTTPVLADLPHVWHWPRWDPIDLAVETAADETALRTGTTTLAAICSGKGEDWRATIRQQCAEEAYRNEQRAAVGLPPLAVPGEQPVTEGVASAETA